MVSSPKEASALPVKEASMWEPLQDNLVRCKVCPHRCAIKPSARGICGTRENKDGKLYTLIYGELTATAVDPIEKKPFFNFWPGSNSFSISSVGCNLDCPWCQNFHISHAEPGDVFAEQMNPEKVVELAKKYGCRSISYTYNEPIIWFEYVLDTAKLAKREGVLNCLVTNGYITLEALEELGPYIDAANVDIKGFTEEFYRNYCKAKLEPILEATTAMQKKGIHVEITTLLIPDLNDSGEEIARLSSWHKENLGPDTPLHFSRYYPQFKFTQKPPTPVQRIEKAREIALKEGLHYVYTGNVPGDPGENTYCPSCKSLLVERYGYDIVKWNITDRLECSTCGARIAIKGKYERRAPWSPVIA